MEANKIKQFADRQAFYFICWNVCVGVGSGVSAVWLFYIIPIIMAALAVRLLVWLFYNVYYVNIALGFIYWHCFLFCALALAYCNCNAAQRNEDCNVLNVRGHKNYDNK